MEGRASHVRVALGARGTVELGARSRSHLRMHVRLSDVSTIMCAAQREVQYRSASRILRATGLKLAVLTCPAVVF